MLSLYKPYFGLFMSKLYSSEESVNKTNRKLNYLSHSPLGMLMKHKVNKRVPAPDRLNIYTAGSKITSLFLNIKYGLPDTLDHIHSKLNRTFSISWKLIDDQEITERTNKFINFTITSKSSPSDKFKKYS